MTSSSVAPQATSTRSASAPRAFLAAAALAAPVLLTIGTALDWAGDGSDPLVYLAHVAEHRGVYLASGVLLMLGMALLPVTAIALFRAATGRGRNTLLKVGAVLIAVWGVFAVAGVSSGYNAGLVSVDLVGDAPDELVRDLFDALTYGPFGMIGGVVGGAAFVLGLLLAGIGVIRARPLPTWSGILLLAGVVAPFVGGPIGLHWVNAAGFLLFAAGVAGLIPSMRIPDQSARDVVE